VNLRDFQNFGLLLLTSVKRLEEFFSKERLDQETDICSKQEDFFDFFSSLSLQGFVSRDFRKKKRKYLKFIVMSEKESSNLENGFTFLLKKADQILNTFMFLIKNPAPIKTAAPLQDPQNSLQKTFSLDCSN